MTVTNLEALRNKKGFICDMDGVIYHGNLLLPGVREFVDFLKRENKKFLFLTKAMRLLLILTLFRILLFLHSLH